MAIGAGLAVAASDVLDAVSPWVAYSPLLFTTTSTTPTSVARTITRAVWRRRGNEIACQVDLTANATTTGGASVQLPIAAVARQVICGSGAIMGASAPTQSGLAFMSSSLNSIIIPTLSSGFNDIISGQTFRFSVIYQV